MDIPFLSRLTQEVMITDLKLEEMIELIKIEQKKTQQQQSKQKKR